jgi:hypothetical protein
LATLTQLASRLACTAPNITAPAALSEEGSLPIPILEMDFTEIQPRKTYRYLLVVVCTFTGLVEAYPICMEKSTEVSRELAKEIIPRFGVSRSIGSDNGPCLRQPGGQRHISCSWVDLGFAHLVSPPIIRPSGKDEQDYQDSTSKTMSRDRATLARCITLGTVQN